MKHSPGPWTYEGDHTHRQFNIRMLGHLINTKDEAKHVCTVNNLPRHVLQNRDPSIAEANARLIAAAPDMLALLSDLTTAWDASRLGDGGHHAMIRRAHAIITRVEGGAA
jgi:hypothetical protein